MRLFFYGTLLDPDVRLIVMGDDANPHSCESVSVRGYRRVYVAGRSYPMLVGLAAGRVAGLLVQGVGKRALRRLIAYEGAEYFLRPVRLIDGRTAMTFMGSGLVTPSRRDWSLPDWRMRHKKQFLRQAQTRRWVYRDATSSPRSTTRHA